MTIELPVTLSLVVFQSLIFAQTEATATCYYSNGNPNNISTVACDDSCCTNLVAASSSSACCSSFSWGTVAIVFFVIVGVCILVVCLIYCRPLWKACCCNHRCPCGNRSRVVNTPDSSQAIGNPTFVIGNDDLPDYHTIAKGSPLKEVTPPPYNFVTEHPSDFGIGPRVPSAPPQYQSRRASLATIASVPPVE